MISARCSHASASPHIRCVMLVSSLEFIGRITVPSSREMGSLHPPIQSPFATTSSSSERRYPRSPATVTDVVLMSYCLSLIPGLGNEEAVAKSVDLYAARRLVH